MNILMHKSLSFLLNSLMKRSLVYIYYQIVFQNLPNKIMKMLINQILTTMTIIILKCVLI